MKANLRITATFNPEVSDEFKTPGLKNAIIIDDQANIVHYVYIEYAVDKKTNKLYRRLKYIMAHMTAPEVNVIEVENHMAQELLYKIALNLSGATLVGSGRNFEKSMFILPNDEVWDDVLPTDKPKPAKKKAKKDKLNEGE